MDGASRIAVGRGAAGRIGRTLVEHRGELGDPLDRSPTLRDPRSGRRGRFCGLRGPHPVAVRDRQRPPVPIPLERLRVRGGRSPAPGVPPPEPQVPPFDHRGTRRGEPPARPPALRGSVGCPPTGGVDEQDQRQCDRSDRLPGRHRRPEPVPAGDRPVACAASRSLPAGCARRSPSTPSRASSSSVTRASASRRSARPSASRRGPSRATSAASRREAGDEVNGNDLEALAELRGSIAEVSPHEDYGRRVSVWNDMHHRSRAAAVYDVAIARVAAAGWSPADPRDSQHADHLQSHP